MRGTMTGKPDAIDRGTDRGNERSDEQVLNDLGDVEQGGELGDVQPGGDRVRKTEETGDGEAEPRLGPGSQ